MTGNVGVLREMCQPRALLRYRSNRRLSFRAQSPPPSTGVVVALGLIALVFPAPGSPARAQDASTPGAQDFVPVVNSPVEGQAAEPIGTSEASRGAPLTL